MSTTKMSWSTAVGDGRGSGPGPAEQARDTRGRRGRARDGASLAPYGAFVDIGGVDGLLHVGDISWSRVTDPSTELAVGDVLDLKVLKVDKQAGRISLGLKQMSPDPWEEAVAKLNPGDRVTGEVTRLVDFGAFVEVMPGVEGLIHVSEMSWTKRIQRPATS